MLRAIAGGFGSHRPGRAPRPLRRALLRQRRDVLGGAHPGRGAEPDPGPVPRRPDRPGRARRHRPGPGRRRPARAGPAHPARVPGQHGPGAAGAGRRPARREPCAARWPRARSPRWWPTPSPAPAASWSSPDEAEALVWTDAADAGGLADLLAGLPDVRWVQLPFAGVDRFAGLFADGRTWTSTKGAYSEPVAEHALALGAGRAAAAARCGPGPGRGASRRASAWPAPG